MPNLIDMTKPEAPATYCLMSVIAIISLAGIYKKGIFAALLLHPYSVVRQRQYYRLFTSDFVHNDFIHLIFNEISLYIFCANLEVTLTKRVGNGSLNLLLIFVISELIANSLFTWRYRDNFDYSSAGCSGGVIGCLFAFMVLAPYGTAISFAFIGGVKNIITGIVYILLLVYYKWKKDNDMINHDIHFYGAIGGLLAVLIVDPSLLF